MMTRHLQRVRQRARATAFAAITLSSAAPAGVIAQQPAGHSHGAPALTAEQVGAVARAQIAINVARDSVNVRLARPGNKTTKAQQQLQDTLRSQIAAILRNGGLTEEEYQRRTFLVSSDTAVRRMFDSVVVVLTGAPLPGQVARGMQYPVPDGPVGEHLGHVLNGFNDTPNEVGLLPMAIAEARVAAQHAALAARQPENLNYMKTHAGHVVHAIDPTIVKEGPGQGYGLGKAVSGVITHMELALKAGGATRNVTTHAAHVLMGARNTQARAREILALAEKVQGAADAATAAAAVSQIASLAEQLSAGFDADGDGRITYEEKEGGLQHVEQHARFMLRP